MRALLTASAVSLLVGFGGGWWALEDRYASIDALRQAEAALVEARREVAVLEASVAVAQVQAAAARREAEEAAAFGEAQLLRAADLGDLIDEIYSTEGGDVPAPDLLLRAIGLRE